MESKIICVLVLYLVVLKEKKPFDQFSTSEFFVDCCFLFLCSTELYKVIHLKSSFQRSPRVHVWFICNFPGDRSSTVPEGMLWSVEHPEP